jgi:hypothetical protein
VGDRTSFQVTIYECPPDKVAEVLAVIEEYDLGVDWNVGAEWNVGGPTPGDKTELVLGQQYNRHEMLCGSAGEIAGELNEIGATYECWEDPKYEWLGEYHAHTPQLGHFSGECDSNGSIQVIASTLIRLVEEAQSLDELRQQITALTGGAWEEALVPLRAREHVTLRLRPEEA